MNQNDDTEKYLPLSEATFYIMLMLVEPKHGYSVMQEVEALTAGQIKIGPGTLYGAFSTLEKEGLLEMIGEEARRKIYTLTGKGHSVLQRQMERLELMVNNGHEVLRQAGYRGE
ncbi:MAG: lineage-specific thermal regulator protein [Chloroflexi bacterium ADurb.Bin360]|nr:MAG: lineage-specific thermal regulator protein [Chloroflexi bacterium ADurb.Bin360]